MTWGWPLPFHCRVNIRELSRQPIAKYDQNSRRGMTLPHITGHPLLEFYPWFQRMPRDSGLVAHCLGGHLHGMLVTSLLLSTAMVCLAVYLFALSRALLMPSYQGATPRATGLVFGGRVITFRS